ncbi:MAG: sulfur transferase domain-containing protein [Litoreibacter sp.]
MAEIKKVGFRAIICNRPDGEGADQPSFEEIEKAAKKVGLVASYLPVETGMVTNDNVAEFGAVVKDLPRPLLGYCKSGRFGLYTKRRRVLSQSFRCWLDGLALGRCGLLSLKGRGQP